jgi:hypothetical protein
MARAFAGVPNPYCMFSASPEDKSKRRKTASIIFFVIGRFAACCPSLVPYSIFHDKYKI